MYAIERKSSGSGMASDFYYLKNSDKGFKAFDSYDYAFIARYNQHELSKYNLAPRVYSEVGRVRVGNSKKLSKWGYITEVAETLCCKGNSCDCCDRDDMEQEILDELITLCEDMEEYGFYFPDNHIGNVGYIYRNDERILVCIDTGDESVQSDDGPCYCVHCKNGKNCREYSYYV